VGREALCSLIASHVRTLALDGLTPRSTGQSASILLSYISPAHDHHAPAEPASAQSPDGKRLTQVFAQYIRSYIQKSSRICAIARRRGRGWRLETGGW
jgi:hypothetical protein